MSQGPAKRRIPERRPTRAHAETPPPPEAPPPPPQVVYVQQQRRRGCTSYIGIGVIILVVLAAIGYAVRPATTTTTTTSSSTKPTAPPTTSSAGIIEGPTSAPILPTATAQPLAPALADIAAKKRDLTDAQWDVYAASLKGKRITGWYGPVSSVDKVPFSDNYRMIINTPDPVPGYAFDVYVDMPQADALKINKGAIATVSGTIRQVNCMLTNCPIELEDGPTYTVK